MPRPTPPPASSRPAATLLLLLALALLSQLAAGFFFVAPASISHVSPRRARALVVEMRDASMVVDFAVGDRVRIKSGVVLDGKDWGGLEGIVNYTWEKCEVDPHCCCAELGTDGPIRVDFKASEQSAEAAAKLGGRDSDYNMFNEGELVLVTRGSAAGVAATAAGAGGAGSS